MTLETLKVEFQADAGGLEGKISGLVAALDGFGGALDAVQAQARPAGSLAADAFAGGVLGGAGGARQAAAQVLGAARFDDPAAVGAATRAGAALSAGLARGIANGSGAVYAAIRAMINRATAMIRSLLGIHSPSRVAGEFGGNFAEGFARGIEGAVGRVAGASAALAQAAAGGLDAALPGEVRGASPLGEAAANAVLDRLDITIPLNVDGIRLGEASIRGINAVTRSAGRLLLEI